MPMMKLNGGIKEKFKFTWGPMMYVSIRNPTEQCINQEK